MAARLQQVVMLLGALFLIGCEPGAESDARQAFLDQRAERLAGMQACRRDSSTLLPALVAEGRCFEFERPEDATDPDSRTLSLKTMILPAIKGQPAADPLVILVGGPGEAATEAGLVPARHLARVRQERDIILLDQRGTGRLSPFDCAFDDAETLIPESDLESLLRLQADMLETCLEESEADPTRYTTDIAVDDLEALRRYMGYDQFNIWGGSYGTRAALAYLQAWPSSVRSVVLDGLAPPSIKLPLYMGRDASAALERLIMQCEESEPCNARFPDLRSQAQSLFSEFSPTTVTLRDFRADTGEEIEINQALLQALVRSLLYSREMDRLLPLMIEQFTAGDYQALAPLLQRSSGINQGMFLSVVCSEDYSLIEADERAELEESDALLDSELLVASMLDACDIWPKRDMPASYFEPVTSDKPVLLLSGSLDPVTPPRWGDRVAGHLSNARHLTVEGVGHITLPYGCVSRLVDEFIDNPQPGELEAGCLASIGPRPFFLNAGGSASDD